MKKVFFAPITLLKWFCYGYYIMFISFPCSYKILDTCFNPVGGEITIRHIFNNNCWIKFWCRDRLKFERIIHGLNAESISIVKTKKMYCGFKTTFQPCA